MSDPHDEATLDRLEEYFGSSAGKGKRVEKVKRRGGLLGEEYLKIVGERGTVLVTSAADRGMKGVFVTDSLTGYTPSWSSPLMQDATEAIFRSI